jgi:hypothetical protein
VLRISATVLKKNNYLGRTKHGWQPVVNLTIEHSNCNGEEPMYFGAGPTQRVNLQVWRVGQAINQQKQEAKVKKPRLEKSKRNSDGVAL